MVTILNKKRPAHKIYGNKVFSLRSLILISYIFLGILPTVFLSIIVDNTLYKYFVAKMESELFGAANTLSGTISEANFLKEEGKRVLFDNALKDTTKEGKYRILVINNKGFIINDSNKKDEGVLYLSAEVSEALENQNSSQIRGDVMHCAVPIYDSASAAIIGVVLVTESTSSISSAISTITGSISIILLIIIIIVIAVSILISQMVVEPLKNVVTVLERISDGYMGQRVEPSPTYEMRRIAEAFNIMSEKLEKMDASRQEFVSNVSHELKTPLSSIKVLSESLLFQDNVPTEVYKEFLVDINTEIYRMTAIINDLLTLVKFDQKEIPLTISEVLLSKIVADLIKRLTPIAERKNIKLVSDIQKSITIAVDSTKISLAISNLIENAIKYTLSEGTVTISVSSDHQNAFITVADTGIGIAEEELSKVFDRFYRVDKMRDRETGGTGLGLSITQKAVLMHSGSIKVSSKENVGTTFVIRLPFKQTDD